MKKIIFVCHGNICRSPMAEYILKDYATKANLKLDICSRATSNEEIGNDIYYATKEILDKYQIPYQKHYAAKLTQKEIDNSDYLIVMDNHNLDNLKRQYNIKDKRIYKILLKYTKIFILLLIVIKSADMILCKRNEENIIPHHQ